MSVLSKYTLIACSLFAHFLVSLSDTCVAQSANEASHKKAFSIVPKLDSQIVRLESFCLGTRGILWIGCRVVGKDGAPDSGHMIAYDPNGLLFTTFPLPIIPQSMNFNPRGWLYVASDERIARVSLTGTVEASLTTPRLFKEDESVTGKRQVGRPAIAANDDAIFVAYPEAMESRYSVWRLSTDLSVEAKLLSNVESCKQDFELQTDGENLLIGEATRRQVGVYSPLGVRVGSFNVPPEKAAASLASSCDAIAIRAFSGDQILTGDIATGVVKRWTYKGAPLGTVAAIDSMSDNNRVVIDYDPDRNWYYWMDSNQGEVVVLLPAEEVVDEPKK